MSVAAHWVVVPCNSVPCHAVPCACRAPCTVLSSMGEGRWKGGRGKVARWTGVRWARDGVAVGDGRVCRGRWEGVRRLHTICVVCFVSNSVMCGVSTRKIAKKSSALGRRGGRNLRIFSVTWHLAGASPTGADAPRGPPAAREKKVNRRKILYTRLIAG